MCGPAWVTGAVGDVEGASAAVAVRAAASDDAVLADSGAAGGGLGDALTVDCRVDADVGRRGSEAGATAVVLLAAGVGWTSRARRARA